MGEASNRKKAQKAKKWELMEHVVALLEQSLVPDAKIERNQFLVNNQTAHVSKTPHKRQCDVVIREGVPPRQRFTIVEVQKRAKNVEYKEYSSWTQKMNEVGAAGLICVAEKGFPQSVIDNAKLHGDRVKLLTLSQLEGTEWPLNIADRLMWFSKLDINLKHADVALASRVAVKGLPSNVRTGTQILRRVDTGATVTAEWLSQLESVKYRQGYDQKPDGDYPGVKWQFKSSAMLSVEFQHDSVWYPVDTIDFIVDLKLKRHCLPLTCSKYMPIDFGGILAYALTAGGTIEGREVNSRVILRPTPEGGLRYMTHEITGFPETSLTGICFRTNKPGTAPQA